MPDEITSNKKELLNEVAIIDSAVSLFGSRDKAFQRYNPSVLISNKGFSVLDKMRRDDQIKAALALKKNAVIATGWEICSPEDMPHDWEVTEFVKENLTKISGALERIVLNICSAIDYGFSVSEKTFREQNGKLYIDTVKTKKPHDIRFNTDAFGNLREIEQSGVKLPVEKFIVYSYEKEFENHYGTSDLEAAYRAWWTKDNSYKWLAMLLERMGIPPIFALYEQSAYQGQQISKLQEILEGLQSATVAAIPMSNDNGKPSIDFWTPELAGNVASVFIPSLDMLNRDIARAILMPGLLGATPDNQSGSYARSKVHFDVFMMVVERIRSEIACNVINQQLIKQIVDLNFNVDSYPEFKWLPLTDNLRVDILETWKNLATAGVVNRIDDDEKHIRKLLDFPENDMEGGSDETNETGVNAKPDQDAGDSGEIKSDDYVLQPEADESKLALKLTREKNNYEKHVDFAQLAKTINTQEQKLIELMREILMAEQAYLTNKLRSTKDISTVEYRPATRNKLIKAMQEVMLETAKAGEAEIFAVKKNKAAPGRAGQIGAVAQKWVVSRAKDIAGIMSDKLNNEIKLIISNAMRAGTPVGEIISQVEDSMLPYVGNDNVIEDDEVLEPHRIETVVRTNITQAHNQGKLAAMRDPDVQEYIHGVTYSAIMDERTTEICSHLDGRVFAVDDPDLDRLTPPNHFNSVPAETLIKTIDGDKPISKIKVNDLVMTHKGRYRKVYSVMSKRSDHPKVKELHLSTGAKLRITDEHPILTTSGWSLAGDVEVGDILFQNGYQMPGGVSMGIFSPDNYPSFFDEIAVPYLAHSFSSDTSFIGIDFKTDSDRRPSEVNNVTIDGKLKNHSRVCMANSSNKFILSLGWLNSPRVCPRNSGKIGSTFSKIGIAFYHPVRMIFENFGCIFSKPKSPMISSFSLETAGRVSDFNLANSSPYSDAVTLAPIGNNSFTDSKFSLNGTNGFIFSKMLGVYKFLKNIFIPKINHNSPSDWSGAAIISIVDVENKSDLYNLAIEEDETYLANEIIVHNCRSQLVPIMIDTPIDKKDLLSKAEKGKAFDLAGKGFV